MKKFFALVLMITMIGLAACSEDTGQDDSDGQNQGNEQKQSDTADYSGSALEAAYEGKFEGTTVSILGPFSGADEVKFNETIKGFEEKTGIDIVYEYANDFGTVLNIRIDGGNAPDIANFPQPGLLEDFVKEGRILDVSEFLKKDYLESQYSPSWIDMSTMEGQNGEMVAGVWQRANAKSLVWYPKKAFEQAGYEVPTTWDELMDLTEQIAKDGYTPWAIGIESGEATGWPATDWVEEIMLRTTSLENYDKWVTGELPFTSDEVKRAFEIMSEIWMNDEYVYGGAASIVTTNFGDAPKVMFTNPPKAFLHKQGNFITSFFPEGVTAEEYDFFYLPPIDEQYGKPVLVGGDIMAMLNDRPEVRAVMEYFTKGESLKTWIQSGGAISPHQDSNLDWYQNDVERKVAEIILQADSVRFDGSDLMPGEVGTGTFWTGMTDYISGQVGLEEALEEIQSGFDR